MLKFLVVYSSSYCPLAVVFLQERGLYNKDRLGLISVMLACQPMRMHKQIKTRCRIYTQDITITNGYAKGSVIRQKKVGVTRVYQVG